MRTFPRVTFCRISCVVGYEDCYRNGDTALMLTSTQGEPIAKATVYVHGHKCPPGYVLIKNWSENEGILDALVKAGVVEDTGMTVPTGHVHANICKLLVKP